MPHAPKPSYSFSDLYLAYRQAKIALYFERRGVGLVDLAEFEQDLFSNLRVAREQINSSPRIFDQLSCDELWLVPKRLAVEEPHDSTLWVGLDPPGHDRSILEVQLRVQPSPTLAIAEVLFLWRFGAGLDGLLGSSAVGYRLDARAGRLSTTRRWLFQYWPEQYQKFRSVPVKAAMQFLERESRSVSLLSADIASFYDSIDSSFMVSPSLVSRLGEWYKARNIPFDEEAYVENAGSLLRLHDGFRERASELTGLPWLTGIPIGALTSRLVANLALAPLDSWIMSSKDTVAYHRYVDDFVVVSRDASLPSGDREAVLRSMLPVLDGESGDTVTLDSVELDRVGSTFAIQNSKLRIHHLSGTAGQHFLRSVGQDFLGSSLFQMG